MESKRSKIKVHPTPAAARILEALLKNRGLVVMWNGRGARWIGPNWPAVKDRLGDPRQTSVRRLVDDGLLENVEGSEIHWRPSDAGVLAFDAYGAIPIDTPQASAHDLVRALEHHYGKTHAVVTEVPVDRERKRRVDALAVPLRGAVPPISFELKVDRGDFQVELDDPRKREAAMSIAQFFYFVVPSGMVKPDELPPECGLLGWDGRKIWVLVEAPWLGKNRPSWELVAAIAKRLVAAGR